MERLIAEEAVKLLRHDSTHAIACPRRKYTSFQTHTHYAIWQTSVTRRAHNTEDLNTGMNHDAPGCRTASSAR